jgi:putative intracellular protease/amidase
MKKILILVTNHPTLGKTDEKNGTYAPELTHALHEFIAAGYEYDIASIKGGKVPLYGEDVDDAVNRAIFKNADFLASINNTIPADQLDVNDYDAVFYPGGFGLLSDLAENADVARLTAKLYDAGKVVGAVCHGPAGLLPVVLSDGTKLLNGKHVTGFTREEEVDFGTIDKIPFLLEEALTRNSGRYSKGAPWLENVIVDGMLVTGQNPGSAHGVGKAMVALIQALG